MVLGGYLMGGSGHSPELGIDPSGLVEGPIEAALRGDHGGGAGVSLPT